MLLKGLIQKEQREPQNSGNSHLLDTPVLQVHLHDQLDLQYVLSLSGRAQPDLRL